MNLGCGGYSLDGYTNIDLYPPADIVGDFTSMDFSDVMDVQMIHSLEHISWLQTPSLLARIRSWLAADGELTVEVPDMAVIMEQGSGNGAWQQWIYGCQAHEGEYHRAGFTNEVLCGLLETAGYTIKNAETFLSDHPMRVGFPCLRVVACV